MARPNVQHGADTLRQSAADNVATIPIAEAELSGIDVKALSPDEMSKVLSVFRKKHIVVLRDQHVGDEDIYNFAKRFGPVVEHATRDETGSKFSAVHKITNLDAQGKPSANPGVNENYYWHSDKSHTAVPSLLTMLYGVEIPPDGGDTEFADLTRAYEALPAATRAKIDDLNVEHSLAYMRETLSNRPTSEEERAKYPPVVHPMVRIHPDTGRKCLYGVGMYCSRIVDMPVEEGRVLLKELLDHATKPEFLFRQKWRPNDLVFWDNRCLVHRAIANYEMTKHRRVLKRIVVQGDVPRRN